MKEDKYNCVPTRQDIKHPIDDPVRKGKKGTGGKVCKRNKGGPHRPVFFERTAYWDGFIMYEYRCEICGKKLCIYDILHRD